MCTKRIGIYDIMKKIYPREAGERRNDMSFKLPEYHHPDFSLPQFVSAPEVKWELVEKDGVAPEYFHSTSMYPEYFKIGGQWVLAEESRMDSSVVLCDDGPLPEVYGDVYEGAAAMREVVKKSTTVICLATMLHTIATGYMTPSFRVMPDGEIRPGFLYTVDADEFVVNKLLDRGSLSATTIVTNVQDFITIVAKGLGVID